MTFLCTTRKKQLIYFAVVVLQIIPIGACTGMHGVKPSLEEIIYAQKIAGSKEILIPPGVYLVDHTFVIDSSYDGCSIIGQGEVILRSSQRVPVFQIEGAECIGISGLKIISFDPNRLESPIGFHFQAEPTQNDIWLQGATAIRVIDSEEIHITANEIAGFWIGIYITFGTSFSRDIIVSQNRIHDCGYWSIVARRKIVEPKLAHRLTNIRFTKNHVTRCEQGPVFRGVSHSLMAANIVTNNIIGIRLEQSHFNCIQENDVNKNLKAGIWLYNDSTHNHILKNKISDNNLQAWRIKRIAEANHLDTDFLPGDLVCYRKHKKELVKSYYQTSFNNRNRLVLNGDFWPYPTAYEHITPSSRFGSNYADQEIIKKYWGIYFCQWSGVGIELRNQANFNVIEDNWIYNSKPVSMETGYMSYGVRISQLGLMNSEEYVSRGNLIRNNRIENMVKGKILDANHRFGIADAENLYGGED